MEKLEDTLQEEIINDEEAAQAIREYKELKEQIRDLKKKYQNKRERLQRYVEKRLAESKDKELDFPTGKLKIVKYKPKFIVDDEVLLQYAKDKGLNEYIKETIDLTKLTNNCDVDEEKKCLISPNGEIIPGVTLQMKSIMRICPHEEK